MLNRLADVLAARLAHSATSSGEVVQLLSSAPVGIAAVRAYRASLTATSALYRMITMPPCERAIIANRLTARELMGLDPVLRTR